MTEHWHTKLTNILIPEEQRLWERKKKLKKQAKGEYQKAVQKLSQWDKELLLNTNHQQSIIPDIDNYGGLLFAWDEYRKACIYLRGRMK
jgi:hypothetical protein